MTGTKERIMQTALRLFAANGYEAVSVSTIAGELGMTKGALYRHYRNKRDIFEHIVARMEEQDKIQADEHALPDGPMDGMEEAYRSASVEDIIAFSKTMFHYWTEDEFAVQFRRMLTLEQFRNEEMGKLYQQYLAAGPLGYLTDLFKGLGLKEPQMEAAGLYAPMFLLYSVYDGAENPGETASILEKIMDNVRNHLKEELRNGFEEYHHSQRK